MDATAEGLRTNVYSSPSEIQILRYKSIEDVPVAIWNRLASTRAVGLEASHLRAVEESRINDLNPYYLVGLHEGRPVGIAYCFAIDLDLTRLTNTDSPEVLATVKAWRPGFMNLRLLEVGHLASLGTTVEFGPETRETRETFLRALAGELDRLAQLENADLGVIRERALRQPLSVLRF